MELGVGNDARPDSSERCVVPGFRVLVGNLIGCIFALVTVLKIAPEFSGLRMSIGSSATCKQATYWPVCSQGPHFSGSRSSQRKSVLDLRRSHLMVPALRLCPSSTATLPQHTYIIFLSSNPKYSIPPPPAAADIRRYSPFTALTLQQYPFTSSRVC